MGRPGFTLAFPATELGARSGICRTVGWLRQMKLPETAAGEVEIALAEAVNNIVEHAHAVSANGRVTVRCRLGPRWLLVCIRDGGSALPGGRLPDGLPVDVSVPRAALPEGGFGWLLIRTLTNGLRYRRQGGHNYLFLRFDLLRGTG